MRTSSGLAGRGIKGVTLVELMVACSIFAVVITVAYAIMMRGQDTFNVGAATSEVQERARLCMDTITNELLETSIASADTAQRWYNQGWGGMFCDNFEYLPIAFPAPMACLNPACQWVRDPGSMNPREPNAYLGFNYTENQQIDESIISIVEGSKVWPNTSLDQCPHCGSFFFLTNPAQLDAIKFFTPRTVSGVFINNEGSDASPDWQGILFYLPYYNTATRSLELRRYAFYLSDLFTEDPVTGDPNPLFADTQASMTNMTWPWVNPPAPAEWMDPLTHNPVGKPTLFDLLDTDSDGTIDLHHDVAAGECMWEQFQVWNGTWLSYGKGVWGATNKSFWLGIDLSTGQMNVSYWSDTWWRWAFFTRRESYADFPGYISEPPYKLLGNYLADIQISTYGSNPYGEVVNPLGVREQNPGANPNGRQVRITIGFEKPVMVGEIEYQPISVLQTVITPRNQ
ncbi:MAG: prepilin-type N-terminal cleavage/methylation domain-containing protein [Planctomycetota bacterium]|nr:prepilin-type N-terminal cleavage/methylation domain-containing protein [Planctomycetota bacterium]